MSYNIEPAAVCDCGSNELVPARDELAAVEREWADLRECVECGRFVRVPADQ